MKKIPLYIICIGKKIVSELNIIYSVPARRLEVAVVAIMGGGHVIANLVTS